MRIVAATALACALSLGPQHAWAQVDYDFRGFIDTDLRFSVPLKDGQPGEADYRFVRNENTLRLTGSFGTDDVIGVADVGFVFTGFAETRTLADTTERSKVDPLHIESDALYLQIYDFLVPGLDLTVGRQKIVWGSADQFNPTSNLNAYDFEDPIKFGEVIATEMIAMTYTAPVSIITEEMTVFDELRLSLAVVPIFRPASLPSSSLIAFEDVDIVNDFVDSERLGQLVDLQRSFLEGGGRIVYDARVETPEASMENAQIGARLGWTMFGVDLSVSYYRGFEDTVRAEGVRADLPIPVDLSDLEATKELVESLDLTALDPVVTGLTLSYPRIQVLGLDLSTSLDFLGGLGLWLEGALIFHDDLFRVIRIGDDLVVEREAEAGSYWKFVAGSDYSITRWWYMNVQFVHGFVDEFGPSAQGDYLVAGSDFKLFDEQATLRLFGIWSFTDQSWVGYPALMTNFWQNTELTIGAFLQNGKRASKFGSPATGPALVFLQGRYSF